MKKTVVLKGSGKYPQVYVRLPSTTKEKKKGLKAEVEKADDLKKEGAGNEAVVAFGSVTVGSKAERCVELVNVSEVSSQSILFF